MARLFYDRPPGTGSFASDENQQKKRIEKIAKLIPTEIIAGYMPLIGLVSLVKFDILKPWLYIIIFISCWIVIPFYIRWQGKDNLDKNTQEPRPWKTHATISTIAFLFWAYSISGSILVPDFYDIALANIFLGLFTIITGWIPLRA